MPINDPKTTKPEEIFSELFNSLFTGFTTTNTNKTTPTAPTVDPVTEVSRLLKKAEESGPSETANLLQIADRHIRIIELALAYQK
jgi:hypothetical protein